MIIYHQTSRRDFLKIGAIGMGSVFIEPCLGSLPEYNKSNKTVVWLWLGGGPTQVETFDPKPDSASEFQSVIGHIPTTIPGFYVGSLFPEIATIAKEMTFFHSFSHKNSGHSGGTHWLMTGFDNTKVDNGGTSSKPSIGSIISKHSGLSSIGMPNYVKLSKIDHEGSAWIGPSYNPFDPSGEAGKNLRLSIEVQRLDYRKEVLGKLDRLKSSIDATGQISGVEKFKEESFKILNGNITKAFDISEEPKEVIESYGDKRQIGKQLLLARRLAENGVKFVTIHYGGWDNHNKIKEAMNYLMPPLDKAVAAFINDIKSKGMENNVLLVITGEFGRTLINKDSGRDHWSTLSTLAMFGGGFKMGQVIGESDEKAMNPITKPITPEDLMVTIFNFMNIPKDLQYFDHSGRPTYMLPDGNVISELI